MTPDAIKYQISLENEQRLRMRTWQPEADTDYEDAPARPAGCSVLAITPTSRLIVWMHRYLGRRACAVLGVAVAAAYVGVAYTLWNWTPASEAMAVLTVVGVAVAAWNAVKFAVVGTTSAFSTNWV